MEAREYLKSILKTREELERFLTPDANDNWQHHPVLGWVHRKAWKQGDGVNGSNTHYDYDETGARMRGRFRDQNPRIHTFGNSFTHCDQVSDGETWQEYLSQHLLEPIGNYGVGGYSVYQAYRRMRLVEETNPVEYIVLNIWDDDHFRNLDAWRSIRAGRKSSCGLTLPHLKVDIQKNEVREIDNLLSQGEDLYRLSDLDWVCDQFADDEVLGIVMSSLANKEGYDGPGVEVPVNFGLPTARGEKMEDYYAEAALFASQYVVNKFERYCKDNDKKFMLVLSHCRPKLTDFLKTGKQWDNSFLEFLKGKDFPVVDLRDAHLKEFQDSKLDVEDYLEPYYIGHHTPKGNFFFAWALQETVTDWLDPKPLPYREE